MQESYSTTFNNVNEDNYATLATPALLANGRVPSSHKRFADNYIIIKRLYKTQSLKCCLLITETALLEKYNFPSLAKLSIKEVNREILLLQEWAFSENSVLKNDADNLMQIRSKELRHILSSGYALYSNEINNGYRALEKYFEEITKFYNLPH